MRIALRPAAAADVEDAYFWYRARGATLGDRFLDEVQAAIDKVRERPEAYPVLHREARRIRLRRFPYSLLYRVISDRIVIVACMHAKRDPRRWKSRADG